MLYADRITRYVLVLPLSNNQIQLTNFQLYYKGLILSRHIKTGIK